MKKPKSPHFTWEAKRSLGTNAALHLPSLATEYFATGRGLLEKGRELAEYHQFRITTKRFRYTMEMFRPAYGPSFELKVKKLQKVQEILGDLNDASVLQERFGKQAEKDEALRNVVLSVTAKIPELKASFLEFWQNDVDAPGEELRWQQYLSRPLGYRRPASKAASRPARKRTK